MGLFPIKWDKKLNISSLKTEVILIRKCWVKKTTRKIPDKAIKSFFPIEDLNIEINDIIIFQGVKLNHKTLNNYFILNWFSIAVLSVFIEIE